MSSGPHTEAPSLTTPKRLSWPEARRLAGLYQEVYGTVPAYLVAYLASGDVAELGRPDRE